MAIALALVDQPPALRLVAPLNPDCCPGACERRPSLIAKALRLMDELAQEGYEPSEELMGALVREMMPENVEGRSRYELRGVNSLGPTNPPGPGLVADIQRAFKAGHRNPMSIGQFLCPFWDQGQEEEAR
jgi:hypothetical protein